MQTDQLISTNIFCESHHIDLSFIQALQEAGLIELTVIEENPFVPAAQLEQLEKIVRLHYDMDINVAGIETISHLLQIINSMQLEISNLNNRLLVFEEAN